MFSPDIDLAALTSHISYMFHCTIGLDPLGDFSSVQGLSYEVDAFAYEELGRNHSPVLLPFDGPGKPGEVTLEWGMVVRSKLFDWIQSVKVGGDFRKNVYITQLSQQRLPLRVYQLTGAWPRSWQASDMTTDRAEWSTEQLVLVYDQIDMLNLSAIAMAGGLLGSPVNETIAEVRPPGFRPRESGPAIPLRTSVGSTGADQKTRKVIYQNGRPIRVDDTARPEGEDGYQVVAGDVEREVRRAEEKTEFTYEDFDIDPEDPDAEILLEKAIDALEQERLRLDYSREDQAEGLTEKEGTDVIDREKAERAEGRNTITVEELEKELDYSRRDRARSADES